MWVVTGANGFIGSAIVAELNQRGIDDLILADPVSLQERPALLQNKKYQKFLHSEELLPYLKTVENLEGVIHMGACSTTTEMDVEFLRRNNTEYTQRLWETCVDKNVTYIYASSGATYGGGEKGFADTARSDQYRPLNPYGWSKLNFDIWAEKQTKTPPHWYGLRFFNVYGPNEDHKGEMSSVIYKAFQQIRATGSLRLFKSHRPDYRDGEQLRDFVYVKDITHWVCGLMKGQMPSGIYNMGYGKARTWMDLARAVFQEMNFPVDIQWIDIPPNIREQYQYLTEAKMEKWEKSGGTPPQWPLETGIRDYVQNYLSKGVHL